MVNFALCRSGWRSQFDPVLVGAAGGCESPNEEGSTARRLGIFRLAPGRFCLLPAPGLGISESLVVKASYEKEARAPSKPEARPRHNEAARLLLAAKAKFEGGLQPALNLAGISNNPEGIRILCDAGCNPHTTKAQIWGAVGLSKAHVSCRCCSSPTTVHS